MHRRGLMIRNAVLPPEKPSSFGIEVKQTLFMPASGVPTMNACRRSGGQLRTAILLAMLALVSGQPRLWAQSCPSITLTITRTTPASNLNAANQNVGLSGQVAVMFTQQGTVDGSVWISQQLLNVYGT